jgi:hypothetical protein
LGLGLKKLIDFMSNDFDVCILELKAQVESVLSPKKEEGAQVVQSASKTDVKTESQNLGSVAQPTQQAESIETISLPKEIEWNESEVGKWFQDNKIHPSIANAMMPCDGRVLYQLHTIRNESPDFFNSSIYKLAPTGLFRTGLKLRDVAQFSSELRKLFK